LIPINDIVYLELSDFPESAHGYLWKACNYSRNGKGNSYHNIPDPKDQRRKLINYDTVPKATLEKYNIPSKEELLKNYQHRAIAEQIILDTKDLNFFLNIPKAHPLASEYADVASWHKWAAKDAMAYGKSMAMESVDDVYSICIDLMNKRGWRTWKINNLRKFKDSIKPFKEVLKGKNTPEEALQTLISAKFGTNNAAKLLIEPAAQNLLIQLYSDPKKLSFTQTFIMYKLQAQANVLKGIWSEKTLITEATVENYLKRPDVEQLWYLGRHGLQAWRRKFDHVTKRIPASFANAKWVLDGTQFPLYYQEGNSAYARLNVFVVLDEHSWCIVGFMVSESENSEQVRKSLLMACKLNGVVPYQIQYDNSSAIQSIRSQMVIQSIAKYGTATEVGNARAKVIEPFFKQLFARILKLEYGYAFSPVMGKTIDSAQNRDALQVQIKAGLIPQGRQAAIDTLVNVFNTWNSHDFNGSTPLSKYRKSMEETKEIQREFTHMMEVEAFWEMAGEFSKVKVIVDGKQKLETQFVPTDYTYTNSGLRIEIGKVKHDFDLLNADWWSKAIGEKYNVKYDPDKMEKVYLYKDGKPVESEKGELMYLTPKVALHSAIVDHTEGEMARIREANTLRKDHKKAILKKHSNTIELTKQDGTYTPVTLGNMYPKELMNAAKTLTLEAMNGTYIEANEPTVSKTETVEVEPVLKVDRYGFPIL